MQALRGALASLRFTLMTALALLLPAGLFEEVWVWPTAWALIAALGVWTGAASTLLAVFRPASFRVRQQPPGEAARKKRPLIDALGLPFYLAFMLAWFASIPLDVFGWRLLPAPGPIVQALGLLATLGGVTIAYVAIAQNRFAAPTIHDQSGDGQQVIQTGLYGMVRHPFYAGMLLVYPGAALWLGSYAAAIVSVAFLVMTLMRIVIEERWLRDHLPDYAAYAGRVRFRLIPAVL